MKGKSKDWRWPYRETNREREREREIVTKIIRKSSKRSISIQQSTDTHWDEENYVWIDFFNWFQGEQMKRIANTAERSRLGRSLCIYVRILGERNEKVLCRERERERELWP